jgi:hypothetical protein
LSLVKFSVHTPRPARMATIKLIRINMFSSID